MIKFPLMSERDLLAFHKECLYAARCCPQYRQDPFDAEDILLGEVSKLEVVGYWASSTTLWNYGYSVGLSRAALVVIGGYRLFMVQRNLEELENEDYDE